MPKYARLSYKKIKAAIPGCGGIISIIVRKTGYSWGAVRDFIARYPDLVSMMEDEENTVDDMAEGTVIEDIRKGDSSVARWWLARRRRKKFGDNVDITSNGDTIILKWPEHNDS